MRCVECRSPVSVLYEEVLKGHLSLTICKNCKQTADKFVEYEYTLIFLNLVLCKSQAYRHLIYNSEYCQQTTEIFKLLCLFGLLEATLFHCSGILCYMTYAVLNIICYVVYVFGIYLVARLLGHRVEYISVMRSILIASFGKLGILMMLVWDYSWLFGSMVLLFAYLNNFMAILEHFNYNYVASVFGAGVGLGSMRVVWYCLMLIY